MIVFYNPRSTTPGKQPLPLSVLSLAAVLDEREPWTLVDGNVSSDPAHDILAQLSAVPRGELALLAVTVMPGPQLSEAVGVCSRVRDARPDVPIVWGGYFPTQHADAVLRSRFVDFVVRGQGERPLVDLIAALRGERPMDTVGGLTWTSGGRIAKNAPAQPTSLDDLPDLPYGRVDMTRYIHPNYLGRRTVAHSSSFGCPFACSFCAVVAMSNRRWLAQSPSRVERALRHLVERYQVDAVQFHDMDFFISEERTREIADRIVDLRLAWWALGRVDTLMQYSDATWSSLARSGLKMIFAGAESGSNETLRAMNKGGRASTSLTLELAARARRYGIVPEFSFVLGSPPDPIADVAHTFDFVRRVKRVNPATEVILYTYTPVPLDGGLYESAKREGFRFPESLDEWASPEWRQLSMRRGDGLPWVTREVRRRIRNFERVLNAFYPTVTDPKLTRLHRAALRTMSAWRYALRFYEAPYELQAIHRLIRYQRPETTGF
jgi:anaerobic magnesium-protoporphyrin IX monomethyl ester cyclase